ncbi:hypothetical protein KGF57_001920 [Candida theae]|uniref:Uncharacterized protein n=1 Tax=Candida theae TaxID=1198502 RepID=A0AAD5BGS7_9ASCO|nr:uncharacterized protein KGF57_001920 [Candida theae]KAI5960524.1 hypothetical protein KGF57_001920 [Candida theae]
MESKVSVIIDELESSELSRVSKGLYLLETLLLGLVQELKNYNDGGTDSSNLQEFIKSQDNFGFNLTSYLAKLIKRDLPKNEILLLHRDLQGLLLLHPPSKTVFKREANMSPILNLLDRRDDKIITITTITTLIHILLKNYDNYRSFENSNGCPKLIQHLSLASVLNIDESGEIQPRSSEASKKKGRSSLEQQLNFKIIEFLMLYMSEEVGNPHPHTIEMKADLFRDAFPLIDLLIESLSELDKL